MLSDVGRNLNEFETIMSQAGSKIIKRQYRRYFLNDVETRPCTAFEENLSRNRHKDVPCIDITRVLLPNDGYIHASWVDSFEYKRAFICTQAPLAFTSEEFWIMIWVHNVKTIVMLTDTMEGNQYQCFQYWPKRHSEVQWGDIKIRNVIQTRRSKDCKYIKATFMITNTKTGEHKEVTHFRFRKWAEFDVPQKMEQFLSFYDEVVSEVERQGWPIAVHCSDGVGQSGTFITIDFCIRRLRIQGRIDVKRTLQFIRTQRSGAVHSSSQYVFIHKVIPAYHAYVLLSGRRQAAVVSSLPGDANDQLNYRLSLVELRTKKQNEWTQGERQRQLGRDSFIHGLQAQGIQTRSEEEAITIMKRREGRIIRRIDRNLVIIHEQPNLELD